MVEVWQQKIILLFIIWATAGFLTSIKKVSAGQNLGYSVAYYLLGAFVWADLAVFGPFWILYGLVILALGNWHLFLFGLSAFWFIRSLGETNYWLNQQFSEIKRSSYKDFPFSQRFNNDNYTSWFIMQIIMQCISVVSLILSVYFGKLWIDSL